MERKEYQCLEIFLFVVMHARICVSITTRLIQKISLVVSGLIPEVWIIVPNPYDSCKTLFHVI